jgi:hypothetical protein
VKKNVNAVSVLLFLVTVAYYVAAAKGHGHVGHGFGKGFFNGG